MKKIIRKQQGVTKKQRIKKILSGKKTENENKPWKPLNGKMTKIEGEDRKRNATNIDVKVNNDIVRPRKSLDEEMIKTESEAINKKVTKFGKRTVEKLENRKIYRFKKLFNTIPIKP